MMQYVKNVGRQITGGLFRVRANPVLATQQPKFAVDTGDKITGVGSVITSNVPRVSVTKGVLPVQSRRY